MVWGFSSFFLSTGSHVALFESILLQYWLKNLICFSLSFIDVFARLCSKHAHDTTAL